MAKRANEPGSGTAISVVCRLIVTLPVEVTPVRSATLIISPLSKTETAAVVKAVMVF